MSYKTKKSTRNNRLMRNIMRTRNNRMYQLDQVTFKKEKEKKKIERGEPRHWCAMKVRMRRGKSDKDEKRQKSSGHE